MPHRAPQLVLLGTTLLPFFAIPAARADDNFLLPCLGAKPFGKPAMSQQHRLLNRRGPPQPFR